MRASDPEADPDLQEELTLRRSRIALACVAEPGEPGLADAIEQRGAGWVVGALLRGDAALRIPRRAAIGDRLAALEVDSYLARTEEIGARIVLAGDREWPTQLDDLGPRRPHALWCWGNADVRLHALASLAMVGARACTRYGEFVAREWSAELAEEGIAIISGGAYGIDAAAHRGALAVDRPTICVLAGGIDNVYPRGHDGLFAQILERGVLVSEAPPGEVVRRRRFLSRNRIIAALASATCVVEAAQRSGAASTAHHAAELARPVLAVPGPVTSATSAGTNRLIGDRIASIAVDIQDARSAVAPLRIAAHEADAPDRVSRSMREVLDALPASTSKSGANSANSAGGGSHRTRGLRDTEIAIRSGARLEEVRRILERAQSAGLVERLEGSRWVYLPEGESDATAR